MAKLAVLSGILLLIFVGSVSAEASFTGFDHTLEEVTVYDSSRIENLSVDEFDVDAKSVDVYKSYRFDVSSDSSLLAEIELVVNNSWIQKMYSEDKDIAVFSGPYLEYSGMEELESRDDITRFRSTVDLSSETVVIGARNNLLDNLEIAKNPEETKCAPFLRPPENFTEVSSCDGQLESSLFDKAAESGLKPVITFIVALIGFGGLYLYISELRDDHTEEEVEELTEELINDMETGEIPKDEELLNKLKEANEKAYQGDYSEASELLAEVKSEIQR